MTDGLRAADLVFDPTLACREVHAPTPAARRLAAAPNGTMVARVPSSPPAPDSRERSGQGLPLSRTMLSDHKSPYVGRFACDWPRLSTTDPHAARDHVRPPVPPSRFLRREKRHAARDLAERHPSSRLGRGVHGAVTEGFGPVPQRREIGLVTLFSQRFLRKMSTLLCKKFQPQCVNNWSRHFQNHSTSGHNVTTS
jgi:hypothetical protein